MSIIVPPAIDSQAETTLFAALVPPCEYGRHDKYGHGGAEWIAWSKSTQPCGCLPRRPYCLMCASCLNFLSTTPLIYCARRCGGTFRFIDAAARLERI